MAEERIDALNAPEERHTPEQQWNLLPSTRLHPLIPPLSYQCLRYRDPMLSRVFVVGKNAEIVNTLVHLQALPAQEIIHMVWRYATLQRLYSHILEEAVHARSRASACGCRRAGYPGVLS